MKARPWTTAAVLAASLVIVAALAVLYAVPPGSAWFYPRCTFHKLTGLDCPGCGGLRAAHQLLHGDFHQAFLLNPLLVLLAPLGLWLGVVAAVRAITGRQLPNPLGRPAWLWTLAAVCVLFSVVRNLPAGWLGGAP